MKKIILSVFGIFSLMSLNGQKSQPKDSAYFQVFYNLDYVTDLLRPQQVGKDEMLLLVGDSITSYYSYRNFVADSALKSNPMGYLSVVPKGDKMALQFDLSKIPLGLNNVLYFFDKRTNEFLCRCRIGSKKYGYMEPYLKPEWKISDETANVLGQPCQKATSEYGGRNWTVWFAPGIPISEGPWKLKGLPGLIMKAEDDTRSFVFECASFSRLNRKKPIVKDDINCKILPRKEFVDIYVKNFNGPAEGEKAQQSNESKPAIEFVIVGHESQHESQPVSKKLNPLEIGGI